MGDFLRIYRLAFLRPRAALFELAESPQHLRMGMMAAGVTAAVYTAVYFFLAHNGGRPTVFVPWLAIDPEVYYRYNLWFHVPSLFLAWVSSVACTQLVAGALGGRGSFEHTFSALGLGLSIASWWTGLHDLVTTALGYVGVIDQRAYEDAMSSDTPAHTLIWTLMIGYTVWFLWMFTLGVQQVHRLPLPRAAVAGTVGACVYQLVFVIFNR